ncbi:MAG: transposase [Treponema sp.]|jgi:transposase|nr:transposase [Treponema sp.]
MLKAYEYRIYPTPEQEVFLKKTLGLCRLYWNVALDHNKNGRIVGVDWNIHNDEFCVMSDGTKVKSPMYLRRAEKRLARHQRHLSKLYKKGQETQSHGYEKEKRRVAVIHEKAANKRKDFLHKLSREIANEYEFVAVEDINLQTMASGLRHGKVVGDQGFGMLRNFLAYKTNLVKAPAAYTSQTCSVCGNKSSKLTLSDREWLCSECGTSHDRDVNAAKNIEALAANSRSGIYRSQNASGGPRSPVKLESPKPSTRGVESSLRVEPTNPCAVS